MTPQTIGVVGARGLVGQELVRCLEERAHPSDVLRLFGRKDRGSLPYRGELLPIQAARLDELGRLDLVFLATRKEVSRPVVPELVRRGVRVIDCSSAFRMDAGVPLVVPFVNARDLGGDPALVANPNCCAAILACVLEPLLELCTIDEVDVVTVQAISGMGRAALDRLQAELGSGGPPHAREFIGNVWPHRSPLDALGWVGEETKIAQEMPKILGLPGLEVRATCVQGAVARGHTLNIHLRFADPIRVTDAQRVLSRSPLLEMCASPQPIDCEGRDTVLVGRVRAPRSVDRRIQLVACGDQLRRGGALNAVEIAEHLGLVSEVVD
ncbi:MAG: aspartate-semialdehyde dehydrogenase [Acidobacteriota bacterium]